MLGVYDENAVTARLSTSLLQQLRRCLRLVFAAHPQPQAAGAGEILPRNSKLSPIIHDVGSAAISPGKEKPGCSSCAPPAPRVSRLPGDCKVDLKWRADWLDGGQDGTPFCGRKFQGYRQVLSQFFYYMFTTKARFAVPIILRGITSELIDRRCLHHQPGGFVHAWRKYRELRYC